MLVMWNIIFKGGRGMIGESQMVGILKKMGKEYLRVKTGLKRRE